MNRVRFALLSLLITVIIASVAAADVVPPATTVPAPDLAATGSGLAGPGPAVQGTVPALPVVITSPGTYTLDRDYLNLAGAVAIDVRSSGVVIDGGGHTLDGTDAAESVGIRVHGSATLTGVTVKNLRVTDWSKGVYYWDARGRVEGVTASSNTGAGIMLYSGGDGTVITGCTAENNGVGGLSISYAPGVEVLSCTVRSNGDDGIYVYASNNARISGTTVSGNTLSGIALLGSNSGRITGAAISGCRVTANGKAGIYMSRAEASTVANNRFENTRNALLEGTEVGANTWNAPKSAGTNIVGGPYLGGNWWSGFSETAADGNHDGLADTAYGISAGNTDALPLVTPPANGGGPIYPGMKITAPGTYTLEADIDDPNHPVVVEVKCSNVVIEGNGHRISGGGQSQYCGVYVSNPAGAASGVTIRDLTLSNFYYGVYALNMDAGRVERCRIAETPSGGMGLILTQGSDGNTVTGTAVLSADGAGPGTNGVAIISSSQNTITNNEFRNPTNVIFSGTLGANTWNTAKTSGTNVVGGPYLGGNYWAEPDGTGWSQLVADANRDGIGDSPFVLASGNTDAYPLVRVSGPAVTTGSFQISSVGGTVAVPVVLSAAPGGLSGYRLTVALSNPSVATITAVAFPSWATLNSASALPAGQVELQGIDLTKQVAVGATDVTLATLTVRGTAPGSTGIVITPDPGMGVQDRSGILYPVATPPGSVTVSDVVRVVPGGAGLPTDTNGDGRCDDVNGNGRRDFADIVLYFDQMAWIAANEPLSAFDCTGNGRIDFADVVWLFSHL